LGIRSFSSVKVKVLLRELHRDHHPRFFLHAQGGKYCNLYKANMPGLKYGSCRFGSELLRPRTQTCMDSKVVRADFGSGLIRPRAQTCCASPTRTPARLANSPGFKSFRCPRKRIKFSLERFSDSYSHPFACPAVGKFSRASSAGDRRHLRLNFVNRIVSVAEDCLSPERTFHGCPLMQFHGCINICIRKFIFAQCVQS